MLIYGIKKLKLAGLIAVLSKPLLLIPDLWFCRITAGIWDQSLLTVEINTITRVLRQA